MNGPRFAARNPDVQMVYGTTRNEAFHLQLKGFWRNIMHQTRGNAMVAASVVLIVKLLASQVAKGNYKKCIREHELLRCASASLMQQPWEFDPVMRHKTKKRPSVDIISLPASANTSCGGRGVKRSRP